MKRRIHANLSGNEVYDTACPLQVILENSCSQPLCLKDFPLILFLYKISLVAVGTPNLNRQPQTLDDEAAGEEADDVRMAPEREGFQVFPSTSRAFFFYIKAIVTFFLSENRSWLHGWRRMICRWCRGQVFHSNSLAFFFYIKALFAWNKVWLQGRRRMTCEWCKNGRRSSTTPASSPCSRSTLQLISHDVLYQSVLESHPPPNFSTYCLLFPIEMLVWRFCGEVDFQKLINEYIVSDNSSAASGLTDYP